MGEEDVVSTHSGMVSSFEKREVPLFAIPWMDLEVMMLGDMGRHRKKNTEGSHSHVESKIVKHRSRE